LYLEPYDTAGDEIREHLAELTRLTADNAGHQARLPVLEGMIGERMERLRIAIDQRRNNQPIVSQVGQPGVGKRLMDSIRQDVAAMEAEEDGLLERRAAEAKQSGLYAY